MSIEDADIVEMISGNTHTISFIYSCGASLLVLSFNDGCFIPLILILKDRSKINPKGKILCGIPAMGEIFNCGGTLLLMSFHFITVENPYFNLSAVYIQRVVTNIFVLAEMWGHRTRIFVM